MDKVANDECKGCDGKNCKGFMFKQTVNGIEINKKGQCWTAEDTIYFAGSPLQKEYVPLLWNPGYDTDYWTKSQ